MRLTKTCPICNKNLELVSQENISGIEVLKSYKCGHAFVEDIEIQRFDENLILDSLDGTKHARNYQIDGVKFILGVDQFSDYKLQRGHSCVLADQMRLGKTPQFCLAARNLIAQAKSRNEEYPILVLVRAANIYQWSREIKTWVDAKPNGVWIIQGTKNWIPPGFQVYICSMDTFGRQGMSDTLLGFGFKLVGVDECHSFKNVESQRSQALTAFLKNIERSELEQEWTFTCPFQHETNDLPDYYSDLGVDKNSTEEDIKRAYRKSSLKAHPDTGGTNEQFHKVNQASLVLLNKNSRKTYDESFSTGKITWTEKVTIHIDNTSETRYTTKSSKCPKCGAHVSQSAASHIKVSRNCEVVMLSGTPIKNRADEWFVPLNLVAPEVVPSLTSFRRRWLEQDGKGKWSRINRNAYTRFQEEIAPFVLRREKEDVYKDIPKLNRVFTPIEVTDERLKKAYNQVLDDLEAKHPTGNFSYFQDIGELMILRQICGLAKVQFAADYAETFLFDSEKAKLAIGFHHHSVRDAMKLQLENYGVCKLDGQDSPRQKDYIAHKYFEKAPEQLLLLGMMAAKEGLELVYIENAIVLEREFSSADEEQFEYRFYNPDLEYLKSKGLENKITTIEYLLAIGTIDKWLYDLVEGKRQIFGETLSKHWDLSNDPTSFKELMEQTVSNRLR